MLSMRKIVFISDCLSQPRHIKRVTSLLNAGFEVKVYGYNRGQYDVNKYPNGANPIVLGIFGDGHGYLNKFKTLKHDVARIVGENGKDVLYYAFGILAAFMLKQKGCKYVYEISDILYAYPRFRFVIPLIKRIDRDIIDKAQLVVMTSEGFADFHGYKSDKLVLIPNKVNSVLSSAQRTPLELKDNDKIRFAFVGSIRYETTFRIAETIGKKYPNYEFHFYGGTKTFLERCQNLDNTYSNVFYHGAFRNPDDVPGIYNNLDVVVACYTTKSLNERIAEPNKLYEALFFCKPIIVAKDTFLSKQVNKYECGYCVDSSTIENIENFLNSIDYKELNRISRHEYELNGDEFVDNAQILIEKLK